jgi:DNA polymerase alpha subunit A
MTLLVHGMERTCYVLPKVKGKARNTLSEEEENKLIGNVYTEMEETRKRRFKDITTWKCKGVSRKYAFEMQIPHGTHRFLKVKYPASMPPLPAALTGNTFECVFGAQQSMLELFILKRKLKGPCWLTLNNFKKVTDYRRSWSKHEIVIDSPKDCIVTIDDLNKPSPPMVSLSFTMKCAKNQHNTNEIAMLSCIVNTKINQDGPTKEENLSSFTMLRKLD